MFFGFGTFWQNYFYLDRENYIGGSGKYLEGIPDYL